MDQSPFRSVVADHSADAAITPMLNAGAVTSITERRIEPTSRALKRFREFVRKRRALLPRKSRADWSSIYQIATLRQILEQASLEMAAGIAHDRGEVEGLLALAREKVEAKQAQMARRKPRFRGLGR